MAYTFQSSEKPNFLLLDLFPADLTYDHEPAIEAGPIPKESRVVVTDTTLYALRAGSDAPEAFIQEEILPDTFHGHPADGYTVRTTEGATYTIRRSGSCGCGSRLKSALIFPYTPYKRRRAQ